jgi:hypothetical protein
MKKNILGFVVCALLASSHNVNASSNQTGSSRWIIPAVVVGAGAFYLWNMHSNNADKKQKPVPVPRAQQDKKQKPVPAPRAQQDKKQKPVPAPRAQRDKKQKPIPAPRVGRVQFLEGGYSIKKLDPILQGNNNDGGASCGYHALKNALAVVTKNSDLLTDVRFIKDQFSLSPGSWRLWVQFRQHDNGEWIETEHLDVLVQQEFLKRNITAGYSLINSMGQAINAAHVGEPLFDILRCLSKDQSYTHVFLVNTGTGYTVGQNAHWFTVVMEKEAHGPTTYTVMDSLGHNRTQDKTVQDMIKHIHGVQSAISEDKKLETKNLFFDVVKLLKAAEDKTKKETLTSTLLELFDTLQKEDLVDDAVKEALHSVL